MYFPFLRGRQEELLALKGLVTNKAISKTCPVIEPVNKTFGQVERTIEEFAKNGKVAYLILNPAHGDYSNNSSALITWFNKNYASKPTIRPAILIDKNTSDQTVQAIEHATNDPNTLIVYFGDNSSPQIDTIASQKISAMFLAGKVSPNFLKSRKNPNKIVLQNTYTQQNNADYPDDEYFGDLHSKFTISGLAGFGDFTTLENKYSTSGGQPYAVAIHVSYLKGDNKDEMWVNHFKSPKSTTPGDSARKFRVALKNMFIEVAQNPTKFDPTLGFKSFEDCHTRSHFPGLGSSKRYSIMHHIETFENYL